METIDHVSDADYGRQARAGPDAAVRGADLAADARDPIGSTADGGDVVPIGDPEDDEGYGDEDDDDDEEDEEDDEEP